MDLEAVRIRRAAAPVYYAVTVSGVIAPVTACDCVSVSRAALTAPIVLQSD
jgi:hypothetical protein